MENENKQQEDYGRHFANNVAKAATTGKNAVKAAAKAGAGDVAGAVVDILRDENMRRAILAVILIFSFLFVGVALMCGSAIIGTIEAVSNGFAKNWDENWEEQGIASNGNALYLYTSGAAGETLNQTIIDTILGFFVTESPTGNTTLTDADLTKITENDYTQTLLAVKDLEALTGTDGALQKRLDMIKGRVEQRGTQLEEIATAQYELQTIAIALAEGLVNTLDNEALYYGLDLENSSFSVNHSAFELSDIQALKILAAYSIQHDCIISDSDMWDLMDYCGWYGYETGDLNRGFDSENTIYDTHSGGSFSLEIGGVVEQGNELDEKVYQLADPGVPFWTGTFAPQWYYEQIAQLQENNRRYDELAAKGDTEALASMIRYETDADGNIILDNFAKLKDYETCGFIDRLYISTTATLTVSRTEYVDSESVLEEAFAASLSDFLLSLWENRYTPEEEYTEKGNRIYRNAQNEHSFTVYDCRVGTYYLLGDDGSIHERKCSEAGETVTFTNLSAKTTYILQGKFLEIVMVTPEVGPGQIAIPMPELHHKTETIETFTTFKNDASNQAYKLCLDLQVDYSSRGVDELVTNMMGLWPGNLSDTEIGEDGLEYAAGNVGNENLLKTWTDTYTDEQGKKHTVTFERQQGHQQEAYQDYILGVADQLGYDTTGLYEPDYGYGDTIVSVAEAELAYYQANNLKGGMRYWEMAKEVIGWHFGYDAGWCACFVLCCAYQAGCIGPGEAFGDMGTDWSFWPGGLYEDLIKIGGATAYRGVSSDYRPVPGDIIFMHWSHDPRDYEYQHVGIVWKVDEDGKLHIIDGNPTVNTNVYSSYQIGTYCFTNKDGKPVEIIAYVHPNYAPTYNTAPAYLDIFTSCSATLGARKIGSSGSTSYIFGLPRFRESQMQEVVTALKDRYPELYSDELQAALDSGDMQAFAAVWNNLTNYRKEDAFRAAQLSIAARIFVQPVSEAVMQQTGFLWTQTPAREEVLLGLVSTTDNQQALINVLNSVSSSLNNEMTDEEFFSALRSGNRLYNLCIAHKSDLWGQDSPETQQQWATGIYKLLDLLEQERQQQAAMESTDPTEPSAPTEN